MQQELKNAFSVNTTHASYWRGHAIVMLLVYELLMLLSRNPRVEVYNGAKAWFVLAYYLFSPYGTLAVSLTLIIALGIPVWKDWKGIKTKKDRLKDKEAEARYKPIAELTGKKFQAPAKHPFKPDGPAFSRLIFEGLLLGVALYILLRWLAWTLSADNTAAIVSSPSSLDANAALRPVHSNFFQNVALAIGGGIYDELIYRKWIFGWLISLKVPQVITSQVVGTVSVRYAENKDLHNFVAAFLCSLLYALSHYLYPYGDSFEVYSAVYRFLFGMAMSYLFLWRGLAVTAWAHATHDLLYLLSRGL